MTWRNVSIVLAFICSWQLWRDCNRQPASSTMIEVAECPKSSESHHTASFDSDRTGHEADDSPPPEESPGFSINGFRVPHWAMWLAPHPGEDMRAYRDRMVPLVQAVVAPQRARVARSRDDLAALVRLDKHQLAELDGAAQEAATGIEERVISSVLGGDFSPATFKPMTGVATARDVLDTIDRANKRFIASLTEDQRAKLAQHPFDFADYLLFSTKWEDALGITN